MTAAGPGRLRGAILLCELPTQAPEALVFAVIAAIAVFAVIFRLPERRVAELAPGCGIALAVLVFGVALA